MDRGSVPSIEQMLEVGHACGLETIDEAYDNYIRHHYMFFYTPTYNQQLKEFNDRLIESNLTEKTGGELKLVDGLIVDYL